MVFYDQENNLSKCNLYDTMVKKRKSADVKKEKQPMSSEEEFVPSSFSSEDEDEIVLTDLNLKQELQELHNEAVTDVAAGPSTSLGGKQKKRVGRRATKATKKPRKSKEKTGGSEEDSTNVWGPFGEDDDVDDGEVNPEDFCFTRELKEAEPPEGLLMDLLPFQRQFLTFALEQEQGNLKGGILADEMGMGKTIQAISLILSNPVEKEKGIPSQCDDNDDDCEEDFADDSSRFVTNLRLKLKGAPNIPSTSNVPDRDPTLQNECESEVPVPLNSNSNSSKKDVEQVDGSPGTVLVKEKMVDKNETNDTKKKKKKKPVKKKKEDPLDVKCYAEVDESLEYCGATLVVCPLVAVVQWYQEIMRHTVPGALKVAVYQGPKRSTDAHSISQADVVITTYNTLEADFRKAMLPTKISCQYCGKRYYPDRLKVHLRFFCGPDAVKSEALAKQQKKKAQKFSKQKKMKGTDSEDGDSEIELSDHKATIMDDWEDIDDLDAVQQAQTLVGTGDWDDEAAVQAAKMIAADLAVRKQKGEKKLVSTMHEINWRRIILDEAHAIKGRNTNTSKAVFALKSIYRWSLSGTPLQNRVSELYSLIRFLRLNPYSYYFCTKCHKDCMSLEYPFKRTMAEEFVTHKSKCDTCDHGPMSHYCWWNKHVANVIQRHGFSGKGAKAMVVLKHILSQICLRRTKVQEASCLALPPRIVVLRRDAFSEMEKDYYEALYTQSKVQFGSYVEAGTVLNNYAHIFDLLIRLRQAVNHPYLVIFSNTANNAAASISRNIQSLEYSSCSLCRDPPEDPVTADCGHTFCRMCAMDLLSDDASAGTCQCPACDTPLSINLFAGASKSTQKAKRNNKASFLSRLDLDKFESSTKIEALREEIYEMIQTDPGAKGIVFSQFTSMLDVIWYRLEQTGIKCVKLSGAMSLKQREKVINSFSNDPTIKIFLMSLKAGGVALNLTAASHCFIMDVWWNDAMQSQAMDRIHRLGQFKPMKCVKFIIEGTIEERILKLQQKKRLIFEATVGGDTSAVNKLTEDDMRFLFK